MQKYEFKAQKNLGEKLHSVSKQTGVSDFFLLALTNSCVIKEIILVLIYVLVK